MERVHYRRHSPSQLRTTPPAAERKSYHVPHSPTPAPSSSASPEKASFREKLIVQGIISGIIFAVVLALGVIDNPQAAIIQTNLSQAISDHITAEQVAVEFNRLLGNIPSHTLAGEPVYMETPAYTGDPPYPYLDPAPAYEVDAQPEWQPDIPPPIQSTTQEPRIDEDIMREIFGWPYGDDLQPTAPEPIISPEL
ncbi:MAG: hypothetical protein FWD03_04850 [Defluviitaleaceae bacterium]|nr:hypothetical protein [Defluviitaleaceae bacterium]